MKFSTKSRYALRLMAELARYAPGTTVSLKEIRPDGGAGALCAGHHRQPEGDQ